MRMNWRAKRLWDPYNSILLTVGLIRKKRAIDIKDANDIARVQHASPLDVRVLVQKPSDNNTRHLISGKQQAENLPSREEYEGREYNKPLVAFSLECLANLW